MISPVVFIIVLPLEIDRRKEYYLPSMKLLTAFIVCISILGALFGCADSERISWEERDTAMLFYQEIYPVNTEFNRLIDEWNLWRLQVTSSEFETVLESKCDYYEVRLSDLGNDCNKVTPPERLNALLAGIRSAIDKGQECFELYRQYALTGQESFLQQARSANTGLAEMRLQVSEEWEAGVACYKLHTREIVVRQ